MKYENHPGWALVLVMAVVGIVTLLLSVMFAHYILQQKSLKISIQRLQDYYTAEAGIKKAIFYLHTEKKKGINWRTGSMFKDNPVIDTIFWQDRKTAILSVVNDCGYLRIRSHAGTRTIQVYASGEIADSFLFSLFLVNPKPLILTTGAGLKGKIRLNQVPQYRGGSIDGLVETDPGLALPPIDAGPITESISYFRLLLSRPHDFDQELFSPQEFSPQKPFKARRVFVNDAALIQNNNPDSVWLDERDIVLAATADVQISGFVQLNRPTVTAIGKIRILDRARLINARLYSESGIEITDHARVSGILIAPEIKIAGNARLVNSSIIYTLSPFKSGVITIMDKADVCADIINLCTDANSAVIITKQAKVGGFIYTLAPVMHQGIIEGYVFCNGFYGKPITEDTTNTNIVAGWIKPPASTRPIIVPIIFPTLTGLHVTDWQEF